MKQFSRVVDIKTLVSDIKILCTVDQDVFQQSNFPDTRYIMVGPPQPVWFGLLEFNVSLSQ